MRLKVFPAIIALALSSLFGLFVGIHSEQNAVTVGITTGVSLAVTLAPCMALQLNSSRLQINARALSAILAVLFVVIGVIMCFITLRDIKFYLIIMAATVLVFLAILYWLLGRQDVRIKTDSHI